MLAVLGQRLGRYGLTLNAAKSRQPASISWASPTSGDGRGAATGWCQRHRHAALAEQQKRLASAIRGHCNYYGLTGNGKRLGQFRYEVVRTWQKWLRRRSRKSRVNWERMAEVLERYPLPAAKVVHSIYTT